MPRLGVLVVGNEILGGKTRDTNTQKMIEMLFSRGLRVIRWSTVPDISREIAREVSRFALDRFDLLIVSGGMGPTHDDITVEAVAEGLGRDMERSKECYSLFEEKYRRRFGKEPERPESLASMEKMSRIPRGFKMIPNEAGMAEGLYGPLSSDGGIVVMLPGVPREYEAIMNHSSFLDLLPDGEDLISEDIQFRGSESQLSVILEEYQKSYPKLDFGSYPHGKLDVVVRITGEREIVERIRPDLQKKLDDLLS